MDPLLEARDLVRTYGPIRAVDGISFTLAEGELLTVLGPNGAGKSSLLGLLGGALRPQAGEIWFRGELRDPALTDWRREIGVLSHRTSLYGALSARENLAFYGRLYGLAGLGERIEAGLAEVGLEGSADRWVREFSRGMRQRLALARTLLHDPSLVLLDEPFTGLDVHASALLRDVLARLKDGRRTVILVTHNLSEGLALANRVAIQNEGRFAFLGDPAEIPQGGEERFYRQTVERPRAPGPGWRAPGPGARTCPPESGAGGPRSVRRYLSEVRALAAKDLRIELRTRERFASMTAFVVLSALLFNYAVDWTLVSPQDLASALIWMIIVLGGLLGLGRTFELEKEDGAMEGLLVAPIRRDALFLGKVVANCVLLGAVEAIAVFAVALFYRVNFIPNGLPIAGVLCLGTVGFVALGTLFSGITAGTRMGETLLPVLLFPLLVPLVVFGASATSTLLAGFPAATVYGSLRLLTAFALLALACGMGLFRYVVEE